MSKHLPLVLVRWRDATTFYGWKDEEEIDDLEPMEIETVGFLLKKTKKYIRIVPGWGQWKDKPYEYHDPFLIPRQWVMEILPLGILDEEKKGE